MAARTRSMFHSEDVKAKIKTSQLLNRLQDNALAEAEFLTRGQIDSIKALLAKTIPDLKSVELTTDPDNPITVVSRIELVSPDVDHKA